MAVTYTNNWKNILDKLQSILRTEFGGALPVYYGEKQKTGNHSLQMVPVSSELLEYAVTSETREFTISFVYTNMNSKIKETDLDYILKIISRIEALIHDNIAMTLADSTKAFNCRLDSTVLDSTPDEEIYTVEWVYKCSHSGNFG
jgi:hypothetical protein|tara:strand:+ start:400 stop:834 length:435 start_codon:yes stop_codon:yes gene_type:complete